MNDIDARLRNWGRVVRDAKARSHSTGSLEGNWRSPQPWNEPVHGVAPPLTATDIDDGWCVETAWATLPSLHRNTLRAHYCWRTHYAAAALRAARKSGTIQYAAALELAQAAILTALQRDNKENRNIVRAWVRKTLAFVGGKYYNAFTADRP